MAPLVALATFLRGAGVASAEGRRNGFDVEAYAGVAAPLACPDSCGDGATGLGRTFGGALLWRVLPHLAIGVAGGGYIHSVSMSPPYPRISHVYSGLVGPVLRGYFRGEGSVDGYVGITLGPSIRVDDTREGGSVGSEHVLGADIRLTSRLRFTPSVAFSALIPGPGGFTYSDDGPIPVMFTQAPVFSLSLRLGLVFAVVK
jgi:hypothetical protein